MSEQSLPEVSRLLTLNQVAAYFSVCRRTIERDIAEGNFPRPLLIRGSLRFDRADIEAHIAKLKAEAASPFRK